MAPPTLSVILPNYNHARYLSAALRAILNQSVPPTEVIVIDDASTDNSMEVIREFAKKHSVIRIYQNEKNQGVIYGLNRGIELAKGDYVITTSADDEILPGLFERSLNLLARYPQAALSCTVCRWSYVDSGLTWHMGTGMADEPRYLSPDDLVRIGRRGKLFIGTSSAIMRKQPLIDVGGFIPDLRWHCDWFAVTVPAFRHGICFVSEPLSEFNIHSRSYYSSGRKRGEHRQVLLKLVELLNSPACADVRARVRDSGALSLFAMPMLRILMSRPEYRPLINATLLRLTFRRSAELVGKTVLPRRLARWILNLFYGGPKS